MNVETKQNPGFQTDPKYKGDVTTPLEEEFEVINPMPETPLTAEKTEVIAPPVTHTPIVRTVKRVSPLLIVGGLVALLLFAKR